MADDRLPICRSLWIAATRSDTVMSRPPPRRPVTWVTVKLKNVRFLKFGPAWGSSSRGPKKCPAEAGQDANAYEHMERATVRSSGESLAIQWRLPLFTLFSPRFGAPVREARGTPYLISGGCPGDASRASMRPRILTL